MMEIGPGNLVYDLSCFIAWSRSARIDPKSTRKACSFYLW